VKSERKNESLAVVIEVFILHLAQIQGITKKEATHRLIKALKKMQ